MKTAIIDIRASAEIERGLSALGFSVLRVPPSAALPKPIASHPDMLMCKIGNILVSSAAYVEEAPALFDDLNFNTGMHFRLTSDVFSDKYPNDCIFNALVMEDKIFCKTDSVSHSITELAKELGIRTVHVNQGYPACTVLALSDKAAVTADRGMARALTAEGIDVTLINDGGIALPPYDYGFIGGAAGVLGDTVYFLGDIRRHPEAEKIENAILRAGMHSVSLSKEPLCDLGRIIFAD